MMNDWTRSLALLMVTCAFATGCNPGPGIDPDKRLNELSHEEVVALCRATAEPLADALSAELSVEEQCTGAALYLATTPEQCALMRDACVERGLDATTSDEPEVDCDDPDPIPATCDITVAELEDCYDAWMTQVIERYDRIDCALAGDTDAVSEIFDTTPPAICEPLQTRCAPAED